MSRDELLQQINTWNEENDHQEIINAIEALPREEWGYELTFLCRFTLFRRAETKRSRLCWWRRAQRDNQ